MIVYRILKENKIVFPFLFFVCITMVLAGCLNAKKVNRQVAKKYPGISQQQNINNDEHVVISSPLLTAENNISTTETKTSNILPLLFYWQWDYKNTCTLNPKIPINHFIATVQQSEQELVNKIGNQKLTLSIEKIPNIFAIDDKAHLIFFGYAYGWDKVSIKGDNINMVISYKLMNGADETKKGVISIPYGDDTKKLGMFKNWRKATAEYLKQYDLNISKMSRDFIQQLEKEI